MRIGRIAVFICLLFVGVSWMSLDAAYAEDEQYTFIVRKQEKKRESRWTLAGWLKTREKMRLMDLWLAIHSPSPFEFFIGGDYQFVETAPAVAQNTPRVYGGAYASIFGIEAQLENQPELKWLALFHLRVFGRFAQGTNITFQTGIRSTELTGKSIRNPLLGVRLAIYLSSLFGIEGLYRHYFLSTQGTGGIQTLGNRYEGGAFIEFNFLRLYLSYFSEPGTQKVPSGTTATSRTGVLAGARVWF